MDVLTKNIYIIFKTVWLIVVGSVKVLWLIVMKIGVIKTIVVKELTVEPLNSDEKEASQFEGIVISYKPHTAD